MTTKHYTISANEIRCMVECYISTKFGVDYSSLSHKWASDHSMTVTNDEVDEDDEEEYETEDVCVDETEEEGGLWEDAICGKRVREAKDKMKMKRMEEIAAIAPTPTASYTREYPTVRGTFSGGILAPEAIKYQEANEPAFKPYKCGSCSHNEYTIGGTLSKPHYICTQCGHCQHEKDF